jgi:hypothetical protein
MSGNGSANSKNLSVKNMVKKIENKISAGQKRPLPLIRQNTNLGTPAIKRSRLPVPPPSTNYSPAVRVVGITPGGTPGEESTKTIFSYTGQQGQIPLNPSRIIKTLNFNEEERVSKGGRRSKRRTKKQSKRRRQTRRR